MASELEERFFSLKAKELKTILGLNGREIATAIKDYQPNVSFVFNNRRGRPRTRQKLREWYQDVQALARWPLKEREERLAAFDKLGETQLELENARQEIQKLERKVQQLSKERDKEREKNKLPLESPTSTLDVMPSPSTTGHDDEGTASNKQSRSVAKNLDKDFASATEEQVKWSAVEVAELEEVANVVLDGLVREACREVRFMQWNLKDLTSTGKVQGPLWPERRQNIIDTVLDTRYMPDVLAVEEVKAHDGGVSAFRDLLNDLEPHGYTGAYSDPVNTGTKGERVALFWRRELAAGTATFIRFNKVPIQSKRPGRPSEEEDCVEACLRKLGVSENDVVNAAKLCTDAYTGVLGRTAQTFDRHMVLATLPTCFGKLLHVLILHLSTDPLKQRAETRVAQMLAVHAWRAGAWLVIMGDTNTGQTNNNDVWDTPTRVENGADEAARNVASACDEFARLGTRALPEHLHTNLFPFMAGLAKCAAEPKRNDEIILPMGWTITPMSAVTAPVSPAALAAWAPDAREVRDRNAHKINSRLTMRYSDHLACVVEATLPGPGGD